MAASRLASAWRYARGLAPPVLLLLALVGWLGHSLYSQTQWWEEADKSNMREWLNESRVFRKTLPDLAGEYIKLRDDGQGADDEAVVVKSQEIAEQLQDMADQHVERFDARMLDDVKRLYRKAKRIVDASSG